MCSVEQISRFQLPTMAPRSAGCKRPHALTLAVCDPAAADQRPAKLTPAAKLSADAGALVQYVAPPIEAEPINAVPMGAVAPGRAEPAWIRKLLLPRLKLRLDLPVHFIDEKVVTQTDLDGHQNRFLLPSDGAQRRLRPILSPQELDAANLLDDEAPRPRPPKQQPTNGAAAADGAEQGKRRKKKGKKHGGLPVLVVDINGGIKQLQLSRWYSSHGTIIKGQGYLDFISRCSFKKEDLIEIWAFKQPLFRNFGVTMCAESPLYMVMVKRDDEQGQPAVPPPLPDLPQ